MMEMVTPTYTLQNERASQALMNAMDNDALAAEFDRLKAARDAQTDGTFAHRVYHKLVLMAVDTQQNREPYLSVDRAREAQKREVAQMRGQK